MVESAAEADEELMNKYLEDGDLSEEDIPTKVLEVISAAQESSVNIAGAKILVSGGRGMLKTRHGWAAGSVALGPQ